MNKSWIFAVFCIVSTVNQPVQAGFTDAVVRAATYASVAVVAPAAIAYGAEYRSRPQNAYGYGTRYSLKVRHGLGVYVSSALLILAGFAAGDSLRVPKDIVCLPLLASLAYIGGAFVGAQQSPY